MAELHAHQHGGTDVFDDCCQPADVSAEYLLKRVAATMKYGYWRGPNCWQGVDFSRDLKEAIEAWMERQ